MSRPGRKPHHGARYLSGDLKPAGKPDAGFSPTIIRRVARSLARGAGDARHGSALGILHLEAKITDVQMSAAIHYVRLRGRYDRAMGELRRSARSPDYGAVTSRSGGKPPTDRAVFLTKAELGRAQSALRTLVVVEPKADADGLISETAWSRALAVADGRRERMQRIVDRVLLDDLACAWFELPVLRDALDVLAIHFGVED